jgi:hypothetical protein
MSEPRKYGRVCQLAVRKSTTLRPSPAAALARVNRPATASRPIATSATATPTPASTGCGSASASSSGPPGVPSEKAASWSPMYVSEPDRRKPPSESLWIPA